MIKMFPNLKKEWDEAKNSKRFENMTKGSHYKAWWTHVCKCGEVHTWQQVFKSRVAGANCPYCARIPKKLCRCRSLAWLYPEIAKEWHPTKNTKKPEEVFAKCGDKVWWLCSKSKCQHHHEWEMTIGNRTNLGQGCMFCARVSDKVCQCNSLSVFFPEISSEWHPTKNEELERKGIRPTTVPCKSSKKIWWLCEKGHEYEARIADRTRTDFRQLSCVKCNGVKSFGERYLEKVLSGLGLKYETQYSINVDGIVLKLDFYLPEFHRAIEFDGELHFRVTNFFGGQKKYERTKYLDKVKADYCSDTGMYLLRIHWKDINNSEELVENFLDFVDSPILYSKSYPI